MNNVKKMNTPWTIALWIAMGLVLAMVSLTVHSDETTAQPGQSTAQTTGTGTGEMAGETSENTSVDTTADTSTDPAMETTNTGQSAATATPDEPAATKSPKSKHVVRALLTNGIENREPTDEIVSINKNQDRIYFFTEFTGLKGKMINHRWEHKGNVMGEVNFNVGSNQWRCYSSKNLLPEWTGIWTVSVTDENNNVLVETYFEVTE